MRGVIRAPAITTMELWQVWGGGTNPNPAQTLF